MENLRLAFPKGCRVRLSKASLNLGLTTLQRQRDRCGIVRGWSRDGDALMILWDGLWNNQRWHRVFVERVTA
jgi:hypothetical protein